MVKGTAQIDYDYQAIKITLKDDLECYKALISFGIPTVVLKSIERGIMEDLSEGPPKR